MPFLIALTIWGFFGPYALERAEDICDEKVPAVEYQIDKECYLEAISPIVPLDYNKLND